MLNLISISISKTHVLLLASLPSQQNSPSLPPQSNPQRRPSNKIKTTSNPPQPQTQIHKQRQHHQRKKPSVAEIERAIGAGVFRDRDRDTVGNSEQENTLFDSILSNTVGTTEGPVEKKLRETGEWLIDITENRSHNAGKTVFVVLFLGILPMWMLSVLVASGTVKLPLSNDIIDNLLM